MPHISASVTQASRRISRLRPRIHESWGRSDRSSILIALAFVSAAIFGLFLALSTESTHTATADSTSFGATGDAYFKEDRGGDDNFGTIADMHVKADLGKVNARWSPSTFLRFQPVRR